MTDLRGIRHRHGLGPALDPTQQRLDVLIALQDETLAAIRALPGAARGGDAPAEPRDGETVELREPERTTPPPTHPGAPVAGPVAPAKKKAGRPR